MSMVKKWFDSKLNAIFPLSFSHVVTKSIVSKMVEIIKCETKCGQNERICL